MFSRKIISISIYLMIVILIFIIKPEIMFNSKGEMKNFGYYINEEGKFNKEMNNLATKWWHWNLLKVRESLTGFNDYISGDVVYTKLDETGAECSLSDEEIEEFKLFTIAYQTMTQSQKEN